MNPGKRERYGGVPLMQGLQPLAEGLQRGSRTVRLAGVHWFAERTFVRARVDVSFSPRATDVERSDHVIGMRRCRCLAAVRPLLVVRRQLCSSAVPLDSLHLPPLKTAGQRRRALKEATDLRLPHDFFPVARATRRTVHAHIGPTNSGKTHTALEALREAPSGVYCGPLRLLAWEVHDRLSSDGVPCALRTGQETRLVEGAEHTSCTIEMCSLNQPLAVGVLDEIQMLAHPERGWAWSRALLGLNAAELHVCGSADAMPLLRSLVEACGDELVEHSYDRLTPLHTAKSSLDGDLSRVRAGDCIVAFSRREIFKLKANVEAASGMACGVVYGSLPPETRREQARLFNDPDEAEEVLVASDAVGMGLNLNISRVIFASLSKYDGTEVRPLNPSEVRQIAGRAGRFRSRFGTAGEVTCLHEADRPALRKALDAPLSPLNTAGLAPTFEQLESFHRASRNALPFSELLRVFEEAARVDRRYFCVSLDSMIRVAEAIDDTPDLGLSERHTFCMAPMDARDQLHAQLIRKWARDFARAEPVKVRYAPPARAPATHVEMQQLESYFQALDGYMWLAQRFPDAFENAEKVAEYRDTAAAFIDQALDDPPSQPQLSDSLARRAGRTKGKPGAGAAQRGGRQRAGARR